LVSTMRTVTSLFLVALLVASAFAECVTRSNVENFVGDYDALDTVISCGGQSTKQSIAMPPAQLGGHDALTFEVEVFPRAFTGCVFSYGSGNRYVALRFVADPNNQLGQVHFHVGGQSASTQGIVTPNAWHTIAVVVRNNDNGQGAIATIFVDGFEYPAGAVAALPSGDVSGHLGYCSAQGSFLNGAVDNLIITAKAKTVVEIKETQALIFPFVAENDLVQMWTFNDDGATTRAFVGGSADNSAEAPLEKINNADTAAFCVREAKAQSKYAGARIANKFCQHSGSVVVASGSSLSDIQNIAPFQSPEGGLSQTFACDGGAKFTFNQKWSQGGIIEVTIKTSMHHRWRAVANPGDSLQVEHQNWGGWTRLSAGSGIVFEDKSAYSISDSSFVIQAAGIGWIAVSQNGGFLNYQYALSSAACAAASCDYLTVEEFQYNFQNPPVPEPMGNQEVTQGIQNLPAVLACPNPALNGYNPFMYCWGWWVGPQVNYVRDWNGNTWQMSDPGCCRNQAIYAGNQWSFQRWGYMVAGMTLPWCENMVVPPIEPPKPQTGVPTYPTDPCKEIGTSQLNKFKEVCERLWGDNENDGRYIGCVAQLCITEDPTTVPPPDCRTEKLLATLDSNHVVPATCNNCPGNCNFRGVCNAQTLTCNCAGTGFNGPDCGQPENYPCFTAAGQKVMPVQLKTLDPAFPHAPTLTQSMIDPIYTQFAFPASKKIADTLFIYVAQTLKEFNSEATRYHLWMTSNNAAGFFDADYTITVTSTTNFQWGNVAAPDLEYSEVDIFGASSEPVSGLGGPDPFYPNLDRPVNSGTSFTVRIKHTGSQSAGIVVRNLPPNFSGTITVQPNGGGAVPHQILVGGTSTSAAAKFDVHRVTKAAAAAGFAIGGTICTNTVCPTLGCAACTANAACGWCVETSQCMPGDAAGPNFGECFNWRKTFDLGVSRRVTQIPGYPVNPGLTEVYLRATADANALPVGLGITPRPYDRSEWDIAVISDYRTSELSSDRWAGQIQGFTSKASGFPNSGLAITSLYKFKTLVACTNPRNDGFETALKAFIPDVADVSPNANVGFALAALSREVDSLRLREGTRKVGLFMVGRNHDGIAELTDDVIDALMKKQVMPVFCVPYSQFNNYRALVNRLGFGHIIPFNPDYSSNLEAALQIAGSSIAVTVLRGDRDSTHVDWTAMTGSIEKYSTLNLPAGFRAMFSVPMNRRSAVSDVQSTDMIVPGYGRAKIENIPSARADYPWTTAGGKISMKDNNGDYLIELTGMSFRGLMSVTPKVTGQATLPGQLYRAVRQVNGDEVTYVSGDLIPATGEHVIADGRVVFKPAVGSAGVGSFSYKVFDKCISSDAGTIEIEVTLSNQAPFADMPNLITRQFTPLEFTLGFGDDKKDTTGQYQFRMVHTVSSARDGKLYNYYAGFDPTSPNAAMEITDGEILTSAQVIYMPPQFKYSDAKRAALLTLPCFTYRVEETNETPNNLISNDKEVIVTVTHVNVAPYHWEQPSPAWPVAVLGTEEAWPVAGNWPFVNDTVCWNTCTFEQDMGAQFYWEAVPEYIFLGGNDIEGDKVDYEISSLQCHPGAFLLGPYENDPVKGQIKVGDVLAKGERAGDLLPLIRFKPAPETNGQDYCRIGYKVKDANGAYSAEKIVTIHITTSNKQPRLSDRSNKLLVGAVEQKKTPFSFTAVDPEGDAFHLGFMGCSSTLGLIEFCKTSACEEMFTINCQDNAYPLAAPVLLTEIATNEMVNGRLMPIQGFFTSGDIEVTRVENYNSVYFELKDSVSTFPASKAWIQFDVVVINTAPILTIAGEDRAEYALTLLPTDDFLPVFTAEDPEVASSEAFYYTVTATIDVTNAFNAKFDLAYLAPFAEGCSLDEGSRVFTETSLEYSCTHAAVNQFLGGIKVIHPNNGPLQPLEGTATMKIVLNDNGFSGQCDVNHQNDDPCLLTDSIDITLQWVGTPPSNMVGIASGAAAAGVAGAAAIAAVALFRRLNKKAEESYQPWDQNDADDATAVNPLYQESGSKGENPLFEAKTNL
jgi:hypothetical protein